MQTYIKTNFVLFQFVPLFNADFSFDVLLAPVKCTEDARNITISMQ